MSQKLRSPITSHVLDLAKGKAAAGIVAVLESQESGNWKEIKKSKTNSDGRVEDFLPLGSQAAIGTYRIRFELDSYLGGHSFYPFAEIIFRVQNPQEHFHIPLLLSPFGYSTYRGT